MRSLIVIFTLCFFTGRGHLFAAFSSPPGGKNKPIKKGDSFYAAEGFGSLLRSVAVPGTAKYATIARSDDDSNQRRLSYFLAYDDGSPTSYSKSTYYGLCDMEYHFDKGNLHLLFPELGDTDLGQADFNIKAKKLDFSRMYSYGLETWMYGMYQGLAAVDLFGKQYFLDTNTFIQSGRQFNSASLTNLPDISAIHLQGKKYLLFTFGSGSGTGNGADPIWQWLLDITDTQQVHEYGFLSSGSRPAVIEDFNGDGKLDVALLDNKDFSTEEDSKDSMIRERIYFYTFEKDNARRVADASGKAYYIDFTTNGYVWNSTHFVEDFYLWDRKRKH